MRDVTLFRVSAATLLTTVAAAVGPSPGTSFNVPRHTFSPGEASTSSGGEYEIVGAIGWIDSEAPMSGGEFSVSGGFLFQVSPGDCDADAGVTLHDHDAYVACLGGPNQTVAEGCPCFDADRNGHIDLLDFATLQREFSGEGN